MSDRDDLLRELSNEPIATDHMQSMLAGAGKRIAKQKHRRRVTTVSTVLVAMIMVVVLAVPVSYEQELGVRVSLTWQNGLAEVNEIEAELSAIEGMVARKTSMSGDRVTNIVFFKECTPTEARMRVQTVLANNFPREMVPETEAHKVVRKIKGNVLAALSQGHFLINARGLTDRQTEQAILQELGLMGVSDPDVSLTRPDTGGVLIDVWSADSAVDSFTFEVKF